MVEGHRRPRWKALVALTLIMMLALAACGGSSDDGDGDTGADGGVTQVRGAIIPTATHLPLMVAVDEGIFEANGLEVELTVVQNLTTLPGAMGRQFDFGSITIPDVIRAQQQGIDITMVTGIANETGDNPIAAVVAGKGTGIEGPEDLVGKTVGAIGLAGNIFTATEYWLTKNGVDPDDVNFIEVPAPNHADQLGSGAIDAVVTLEPFLTPILDTGAKQIAAPLLEVSDPCDIVGWMAARSYAEENPDVLEALKTSINEGIDFIASNEEDARNILAKYSGLPPEVAQGVRLPSYSIDVTDEQVAAWADVLDTLGQLEGSPEDVDPGQVLNI